MWEEEVEEGKEGTEVEKEGEDQVEEEDEGE